MGRAAVVSIAFSRGSQLADAGSVRRACVGSVIGFFELAPFLKMGERRKIGSKRAFRISPHLFFERVSKPRAPSPALGPVEPDDDGGEIVEADGEAVAGVLAIGLHFGERVDARHAREGAMAARKKTSKKGRSGFLNAQKQLERLEKKTRAQKKLGATRGKRTRRSGGTSRSDAAALSRARRKK